MSADPRPQKRLYKTALSIQKLMYLVWSVNYRSESKNVQLLEMQLIGMRTLRKFSGKLTSDIDPENFRCTFDMLKIGHYTEQSVK